MVAVSPCQFLASTFGGLSGGCAPPALVAVPRLLHLHLRFHLHLHCHLMVPGSTSMAIQAQPMYPSSWKSTSSDGLKTSWWKSTIAWKGSSSSDAWKSSDTKCKSSGGDAWKSSSGDAENSSSGDAWTSSWGVAWQKPSGWKSSSTSSGGAWKSSSGGAWQDWTSSSTSYGGAWNSNKLDLTKKPWELGQVAPVQPANDDSQPPSHVTFSFDQVATAHDDLRPSTTIDQPAVTQPHVERNPKREFDADGLVASFQGLNFKKHCDEECWS